MNISILEHSLIALYRPQAAKRRYCSIAFLTGPYSIALATICSLLQVRALVINGKSKKLQQ